MVSTFTPVHAASLAVKTSLHTSAHGLERCAIGNYLHLETAKSANSAAE
jgi:hypothetical protein